MIICPVWTFLKLQKAYYSLQCLPEVIVTQLVIYVANKEGPDIFLWIMSDKNLQDAFFFQLHWQQAFWWL